MSGDFLNESPCSGAEKKKIIIVNNNMKIGGVQKALLDLLSEISQSYDVTLLLFQKTGGYLSRIPEGVTVVGCSSLYRYFGMSQAESKKSPKDFLLRSFLAVVTRIFGRGVSTAIISALSRKLPTEYDCAISYMHDAGRRFFYGGCNSFVAAKIRARRKLTFVHCDYEHSKSRCRSNDRLYDRFDGIAACSDGCKKAFLRMLPHLEEKTVTVINCHNFKEILALSREEPMVYHDTTDPNGDCVHLAVVARLGAEKGVDRGIRAVRYALDRGAKVRMHVVGDGMQKGALLALCEELQMEDRVVFYGEQTNPYRYLAGADLLLVPSYHEAAPLVIDEALCLGVPVLSTETTSSEDMILRRGCGWVCENSQEALNQMLYRVVSDREEITKMKQNAVDLGLNGNDEALRMLEEILSPRG